RRLRCAERAADRADRIRHHVHRRLPGRRCALWRARHRPQGLRRHRGSCARHHRGLRVPVLVDIDDGYGDVKNAVHTVQTYERMGASAVFLEDQAWPKRCGHMAGKKVVPAETMEAKIRATMAERLDAETLICVRTDARAVLGLDEALRRAERYINAGAEAI